MTPRNHKASMAHARAGRIQGRATKIEMNRRVARAVELLPLMRPGALRRRLQEQFGIGPSMAAKLIQRAKEQPRGRAVPDDTHTEAPRETTPAEPAGLPYDWTDTATLADPMVREDVILLEENQQDPGILLPSTLGRLALPEWQFPRHIQYLQREVLDLIYDPRKHRKIVRMPVRHGKSYYCSYTLPSWHTIARPNHKCMILGYGSEFATDWSSRVRNLVNVWGPQLTGVQLDPTFKTKSHFRLKDPYIGELWGLGIWGALAGKGAHLMIVDDPQKEFEEVATAEAREKLWKHFHGEVLNRLEPDGKILLVMSYRHPDDLGARLEKSNPDLADDQKWEVINFPALDKNENALWPERYSAAALKAIRNDLRLAQQLHVWFCLYQQDPEADPGLAEWPTAYWKDLYYTVLPDGVKAKNRLLVLDASMGSDRAKGAYSALLGGLVDGEGTVWIVDPQLMRVPVSELERLTAAELRAEPGTEFAIEISGGQEPIALNILAAAPGARRFGYLSTDAREVRIRMFLTPLLAKGKIRIKDTPQGRLLGQQLRDFPLGSHDDGPAALALMVRLWQHLVAFGSAEPGGNVPIHTS